MKLASASSPTLWTDIDCPWGEYFGRAAGEGAICPISLLSIRKLFWNTRFFRLNVEKKSKKKKNHRSFSDALHKYVRSVFIFGEHSTRPLRRRLTKFRFATLGAPLWRQCPLRRYRSNERICFRNEITRTLQTQKRFARFPSVFRVTCTI